MVFLCLGSSSQGHIGQFMINMSPLFLSLKKKNIGYTFDSSSKLYCVLLHSNDEKQHVFMYSKIL